MRANKMKKVGLSTLIVTAMLILSGQAMAEGDHDNFGGGDSGTTDDNSFNGPSVGIGDDQIDIGSADDGAATDEGDGVATDEGDGSADEGGSYNDLGELDDPSTEDPENLSDNCGAACESGIGVTSVDNSGVMNSDGIGGPEVQRGGATASHRGGRGDDGHEGCVDAIGRAKLSNCK